MLLVTPSESPSEEVLGRLRRRLAILEGVISALEQIDIINAIVDQCEDHVEAVRAVADLGYSKLQANAILDIPVGRRTVKARRQLADELLSAREFLDRHQS
jgi:DNA gyrase/topoisomerase IV subunit A